MTERVDLAQENITGRIHHATRGIKERVQERWGHHRVEKELKEKSNLFREQMDRLYKTTESPEEDQPDWVLVGDLPSLPEGKISSDEYDPHGPWNVYMGRYGMGGKYTLRFTKEVKDEEQTSDFDFALQGNRPFLAAASNEINASPRFYVHGRNGYDDEKILLDWGNQLAKKVLEFTEKRDIRI